jgi:type II secretory pathway predicted ATPase ExeA
MYLDHFKLDKLPFQSKPSPEFLYLSAAHARAKAYLEYTVWNNDGLTVITGAIGSGKTTLINHLLHHLARNIECVKIHQTQLTDKEFLQLLLAKLGIEAFDAEKAKLLTLLNNHINEQYKKKRKILLIVDEAQYLAPEVLEEIRFLTGVEIEGQVVFNCILLGHTELMDTLLAPGMEQLSQRVRLRFHLPELSETETREYIEHRLKVAGHKLPSSVFLASTTSLIYKYTGGVPRLINTLCDAGLIAAYAKDSRIVTIEFINRAIGELQWIPRIGEYPVHLKIS